MGDPTEAPATIAPALFREKYMVIGLRLGFRLGSVLGRGLEIWLDIVLGPRGLSHI